MEWHNECHGEDVIVIIIIAINIVFINFTLLMFYCSFFGNNPNVRHDLMVLWFTDLMNVTEEVIIHRPMNFQGF